MNVTGREKRDTMKNDFDLCDPAAIHEELLRVGEEHGPVALGQRAIEIIEKLTAVYEAMKQIEQSDVVAKKPTRTG